MYRITEAVVAQWFPGRAVWARAQMFEPRLFSPKMKCHISQQHRYWKLHACYFVREVLTRMVLILQTCWCKIAFTRTLTRVLNAQPVQKPRLSEKIVSQRDVRPYSGECLITFADELFFLISHQPWESHLYVCPAHVCLPWSMLWKKRGLRSAKETSILSWVSKARDYNNCCCLFSTIIIGCS